MQCEKCRSIIATGPISDPETTTWLNEAMEIHINTVHDGVGSDIRFSLMRQVIPFDVVE